jgi:hypothetical protein
MLEDEIPGNVTQYGRTPTLESLVISELEAPANRSAGNITVKYETMSMNASDTYVRRPRRSPTNNILLPQALYCLLFTKTREKKRKTTVGVESTRGDVKRSGR